MEAIRNLDRIWCALPSAFGIRTCSISDDDLYTGVTAKPIGENLGGAVVEQINGPVRFQIEQQRPIPALFLSECAVINTQNPRTTLSTFVGKGVQQVKQRIGTNGYAGFARQAGTALATSLQREGGQQFGCVMRAAGVMGQHTIEALGENRTWTIPHITEPPSTVNSQPHRISTPGQVERTPKIAAVWALTELATLRARDRVARRFGNEDQAPVLLHDDQCDLPVL
jgi:hypothetical protein